MGALAPVSSWIPEDDVLLKNAVEAGASLESLAKGAVKFSRKFTVREIQERWHSLLYDPIVSANAAFYMVEFERSALALPSKPNRGGNVKENRCFSGKRKAESVRNCYYALRKRICNDPLNSIDLSFLVAPNDDMYNDTYIGNEDEPLSGMLEDPVSNHFGLQETNLDTVHYDFPQIGDGSNKHVIHASFNDAVHEVYPGMQVNQHQELPNLLVENLADLRTQSIVEEVQPNESQVKCNQVNTCPSFGGYQVFSSPIAEHDSSFQAMGYSSSLSELPMWAGPSSQVDLGIRENNLLTGDLFTVPCDGDINNASGYFVNADSNLEIGLPCEDMKNVTDTEEVFMAELSELTDSLLNFTNEEELLLEVGKDAINLEGLSSLLLSSPNDVTQEDMPQIAKPSASVMPCYLPSHSGACLGDLDECQGSHLGGDVECSSTPQFPNSSSTLNPQFPELRDGVICCMLNTEDPEIPCNDDIVFTKNLRPKSFSSIAQRSCQDRGKANLSSFQEFSSNQKANKVDAVWRVRDVENACPSQSSSHMDMSQALPDVSVHPPGDCGAKFQSQSGDSLHRSAMVAFGGSTQFNSGNVSTETCIPAKLKEEITEPKIFRPCSRGEAEPSIGAAATGSDGYRCYSQMNACSKKQEPNVPARIQSHLASCQRDVSLDAVTEQVLNSISETEEPVIESDDDVPYFSDIEGMILDMDLDPENQYLYSIEEVSRYHHEEIKKTIIRLEQGACSYMQRTIASHGAFAILYGRRSKHYIKKPEVLLGRAAEDVVIDIDLGMEGHANKISRRQAIISLDKSGSFQMKNLGKRSIFVNDKEIAPGESLSLTSSCLIEIRGMPFIFEMNQKCVQQYLDSMAN